MSKNISADDIIRELESTDKTVNDDSYISCSNHNDVSFAVQGAYKIIYDRAAWVLDSVGPIPVWCCMSDLDRADYINYINYITRVSLAVVPICQPEWDEVKVSDLDVGDVLLFSESDPASIMMRQIHRSAFSHVGIVVRGYDGSLQCLLSRQHAFHDVTNSTKNEQICAIFLVPLISVLEVFTLSLCPITVRQFKGISLEQKEFLNRIAHELVCGTNENAEPHPPPQEKWIDTYAQSSPLINNNNVCLSGQLIAQLLKEAGILLMTNKQTAIFVPESFNRLSDKWLSSPIKIGELKRLIW